MLEAVFISDLHLHPLDEAITERFNQFIDWALINTRSVYILGDFFHAWAGDDSVTPWSQAIAVQLAKLSNNGINLYFMHGNRDFLLGSDFAQLAGMTILQEPAIIKLGTEQVLLVHGDRYCINDKAHQRFRRLTRNRWFVEHFLRLPLFVRNRLVAGVRQISRTKHYKNNAVFDVVPEAMRSHMTSLKLHNLIHGHTHKPGVKDYTWDSLQYKQYVLSDWDDMPRVLCYDNTKGFYYDQI
ncbi:UDP-2,3-diacylglucosamine diphosphatase [Legionella dresdenensis]|uniref:UDP-2,3-diacylglucosamine hydrolase n=1 Tax=Legionella dresdenensis TaxID=450200 RepID=A0ABV8CCH0_9GAMM